MWRLYQRVIACLLSGTSSSDHPARGCSPTASWNGPNGGTYQCWCGSRYDEWTHQWIIEVQQNCGIDHCNVESRCNEYNQNCRNDCPVDKTLLVCLFASLGIVLFVLFIFWLMRCWRSGRGICNQTLAACWYLLAGYWRSGTPTVDDTVVLHILPQTQNTSHPSQNITSTEKTVQQSTNEGNPLLPSTEINNNESNDSEQSEVPDQLVDFIIITSPPPSYRNLFPQGYEYVAPTGDENNDYLPSYQSHYQSHGAFWALWPSWSVSNSEH